MLLIDIEKKGHWVNRMNEYGIAILPRFSLPVFLQFMSTILYPVFTTTMSPYYRGIFNERQKNYLFITRALYFRLKSITDEGSIK